MPQFAVIQSEKDCLPFTELLALEEDYNGLYLGEIHGSMNTPQIVECFILAERKNDRDLVVSLEMFNDDRRRLSEQIIENGAKGLGSGTPPLRRVIAHYTHKVPGAQFRYHDGYYASYAYADTSKPRVVIYPRPIIEGSPEPPGRSRMYWPQTPNARERSIADAILREIKPSRFILALGGGLHASRATWQEDWGEEGRAGSYLPDTIATINLIASVGGQLRNCTVRAITEGPSCDIYDIPRQPDRFPGSRKLVPGLEYNYDFDFDVGEWIPIPAPLMAPSRTSAAR